MLLPILTSLNTGHLPCHGPHRRHCVVSLSKNINPSLVLVQPRKTRPFITERLLMGRKESNQTNKKPCHGIFTSTALKGETCSLISICYRFYRQSTSKWAPTRENLSSGVCKQQRRRPACASAQTDQRLCYSLCGKYNI